MIALIPVNGFVVTYELGQGRPHSKFEVLVLKAIADGADCVSVLEQVFAVHPRLLVEVLVTLTREGWVAVAPKPGKELGLTRRGQDAASGLIHPEATVTKRKSQYVFAEQVTGGVVLAGEVREQHIAKLQDKDGGIWGRSVRVPSSLFVNMLDPSAVRHILPVPKNHWIRHIGPVVLDSKGARFVPVDVSPGRDRIIGLPSHWEEQLKEPVLLAVHDQETRDENDALEELSFWGGAKGEPPRAFVDSRGLRDQRNIEGWPCQLQEGDILDDSAASWDALISLLATAKSRIFLASAVANVETIDRLTPTLEQAARRGVEIDVHVGAGIGEWKLVLERLRKLRYGIEQAGGVVNVLDEPSGSRANLALADPGGNMSGLVGCTPWLAVPAEGRTMNLRVREPGVVSALTTCAADIWAILRTGEDSGIPSWWTAQADLLGREAARLEQDEELPYNSTLRVFVNHDFCRILSKVLRGSTSAFVAGRCLEDDARAPLEGLEDVRVLAQQPSESIPSTVVVQFDSTSAMRMILTDEEAIFSGFDPLSEVMPAPSANHVGIRVRGAAVMLIRKRVLAASASPPPLQDAAPSNQSARPGNALDG